MARLASRTSMSPVKRRKSSSSLTKKLDFKVLAQNIIDNAKNYNDIVRIIEDIEHNEQNGSETLVKDGCKALLKVFGTLMKQGKLVADFSNATPSQKKILEWLNGQYAQYKELVLRLLATEAFASFALQILFKLMPYEYNYWQPSHFPLALLKSIVAVCFNSGDSLTEQLIEDYVNKKDDIRLYFYLALGELIEEKMFDREQKRSELILRVLLAVNNDEEDEEEDEDEDQDDRGRLLVISEEDSDNIDEELFSANFEKCWLGYLQSFPMTKAQYKLLLSGLHHKVLPHFTKGPLLMDFLTKAYDTDDPAIPLLALNGLFSLMQDYQLDYPHFYAKLYKLVSPSMMNIKYRSRFFRLMELFLSSTHIPAAIVASFVKRLGRLALFSPPAAVVATIPFVYNQLKRHPILMKLIHNPDPVDSYSDPFNNEEIDPLRSGAIDSSLWELKTLQNHYHPNVSTLAKILSEQFRKDSYQLEDFLDLSYKSLVASENSRKYKTLPALEFEVFSSAFDNATGDKTDCYMSNWV